MSDPKSADGWARSQERYVEAVKLGSGTSPRRTNRETEFVLTLMLLGLLVDFFLLPAMVFYSGFREPEVRFIFAFSVWAIGAAPFCIGLVWAIRTIARRRVLGALVIFVSIGVLTLLSHICLHISGRVYAWQFLVHGGIAGTYVLVGITLNLLARRFGTARWATIMALAVLLAAQLLSHATEVYQFLSCAHSFLDCNEVCPYITAVVPVIGVIAIMLAGVLVFAGRQSATAIEPEEHRPPRQAAPLEKEARIAVANLLLFLAYWLLLLVTPVVFGYYRRLLSSPASVVFHWALLAFIVVGVSLSLLEGVRGLRQHKAGAVAAVMFSVLWLLICFLLLLGRLLGVR